MGGLKSVLPVLEKGQFGLGTESTPWKSRFRYLRRGRAYYDLNLSQPH